MSDDLKNILFNDEDKNINNQHLQDYLNNQLSKAQQHELEKNMADDDFLNDAVEGLQDFKNIQPYVEQLNKDLQQKLAKNKKRKEKRRWKEQPFTYISILLIILLLIISYLVIKKLP